MVSIVESHGFSDYLVKFIGRVPRDAQGFVGYIGYFEGPK